MKDREKLEAFEEVRHYCKGIYGDGAGAVDEFCTRKIISLGGKFDDSRKLIPAAVPASERTRGNNNSCPVCVKLTIDEDPNWTKAGRGLIWHCGNLVGEPGPYRCSSLASERQKRMEAVVGVARNVVAKLRDATCCPDTIYKLDRNLASAVDALAALAAVEESK